MTSKLLVRNKWEARFNHAAGMNMERDWIVIGMAVGGSPEVPA